MEFAVLLVFIGAANFLLDERRGLLKALMWPFYLGKALARIAAREMSDPQ